MEHHANRGPHRLQTYRGFHVRTRMQRPKVAGGGNQHTGFLVNHLHVVLNRITGAGAFGFPHLAGHERTEGFGEMRNRVHTQLAHDPRSMRQENVPG